MQKPEFRDLLRAGGWTIGTVGLLIAAALSRKIPLEQLLTPVAIGVMLAIGLAVSAVDLVIVLRNPERLAIARGEKMPSPESVRTFQQQASRALNTVVLGKLVLAAIVVVGVALTALIWR